MGSTFSTIFASEIIYMCDEHTTIYDTKINTLVNQLLDDFNIKFPFDKDGAFETCCKTLQERLSSSVPSTEKKWKLNVSKNEKEIEREFDILPHRHSYIAAMISKLSKEIRRLFGMSAQGVLQGHFDSTWILCRLEFLIVEMEEEILKIIPCRLNVVAKRKDKRHNFSWEDCTINNDYEEQKYTVDKSIIDRITSKINAQKQLPVSLQNENFFNPFADNHRMAFINCYHDSFLFGQKIMTIVAYKMGEMQITFPPTLGMITPTYQKYCTGLGRVLGGYEPYSQKASLKGSVPQCNSDIQSGIQSYFPQFKEEFNQILSTAANHVAPIFEMDDGNFMEHFRDESKELVVAEFTVLKIIRSGENLEIRPSNLKVKVRRSKVTKYFRTTTELETEMEYEERTYILDKFEIVKICQRLEQTNRRALSSPHIPSIKEQKIYQTESDMIIQYDN